MTNKPILPSIQIDPSGTAERLLELFFTKNEMTQIVFYCGRWYSWYGSYELGEGQQSKNDIILAIYNKLRECDTVIGGGIIPFNPSRANVNEILFQIRMLVTLDEQEPLPARFNKGEGK